MNISVKSLKKYSSETLYNKLPSLFNPIYNEYSFYLTKDEYKDIVIKEIDKSKELYDGKNNYEYYIKKHISREIISMINKSCENKKLVVKVINNYINSNIEDNICDNNILQEFNKFIAFFSKYKYTPTPYVFKDLYDNNKKLKNVLDALYKKYENVIVSGGVSPITQNNIGVDIIELYCMINDIEIEETEQNDNQASYYSSAERIYITEIIKIPVLTREQEEQLAYKILDNDENARKKLIESNLRLVLKVANKYRWSKEPILDLIQEGNLGLIKATEKYDVSKGFRFSTYAVWWIKQSIDRYLESHSRSIRIPVYVTEEINKLKIKIDKITKATGKAPTVDELANELKVSRKKILDLFEYSQGIKSLNDNVNSQDEDASELGDFIESPDETPEELYENNSLKVEISKVLEKSDLTDREKNVIILRFGLSGDEEKTLQEVGDIYNITRERVRQIEAKALYKLRNTKAKRRLSDYTDNPTRSSENLDKLRSRHLKEKKYKTYLNEEFSKEEEYDNMGKARSIYDIFYDYTEEQVNTTISHLTEDERKLINFRYGEDLKNPVFTKLIESNRYQFYNRLLPKMRIMLSSNNKNIPKNWKNTPIRFTEQPPEINDIEPVEEEKTPEKEVNIEDMIELLKISPLNDIIENLSKKEALILGFIYEKYFTPKEIVNILGISNEDINRLMVKVSLLFNMKLNNNDKLVLRPTEEQTSTKKKPYTKKRFNTN